MSSNVSHFPTNAFPTWNYNYLDGSDAWFRAIFDIEVYNMFVDALNERIRAILAVGNPFVVWNATNAGQLPHAVAGDYILGFPWDSAPGGVTDTASVDVGWNLLVKTLKEVTEFTGNIPVRVIEPAYTPSAAFTVGTPFFRSENADNSTGTNGFYLGSHHPTYYVAHRKPFEITSFSATATAGQTARFVGASNIAGNASATANLFTNTGAAWNRDMLALRPTVLQDITRAADDTPDPGDYFDAHFIQNLRNKINMAVGFYCGPPLVAGDVNFWPFVIPSGNNGYGTSEASLSDANANAIADFNSGTNTEFLVSPPEAFWSWYALDNPDGTLFYVVDAHRGMVRPTTERYIDMGTAGSQLQLLPTNGEFSLEVYWGLVCQEIGPHYYGQGTNNVFNAFGDVFVNTFNDNSHTLQFDRGVFWHRSGTLAHTATSYTSLAIVGSTTYPNGLASGTNPAGYEPFSTTFGVVRYDVAGGFKYTKDYAGS